MGWSYLGGKTWSEVTRDERYFCQQLFSLVQRRGVREFVGLMGRTTGLTLPLDVEWELAYEVCFFRDLWQLGGGKGQPHSPKRTFDLCLFSERQIIIIEAKAQQGFDKDQSQLKAFAEDKLKVAELTGVDSVLLVGLASSQHISSSSTRNVAQYFDGRLMSWKEMADHYLDEPETTSLIRADAIHSKDAGGKNNEGKLCGDALITAYVEDKRFQVGRAGGLTGRYFARDVEGGSWRNQLYETSSAPLEELNSNWFTLEAFVSETSRAMK